MPVVPLGCAARQQEPFVPLQLVVVLTVVLWTARGAQRFELAVWARVTLYKVDRWLMDEGKVRAAGSWRWREIPQSFARSKQPRCMSYRTGFEGSRLSGRLSTIQNVLDLSRFCRLSVAARRKLRSGFGKHLMWSVQFDELQYTST